MATQGLPAFHLFTVFRAGSERSEGLLCTLVDTTLAERVASRSCPRPYREDRSADGGSPQEPQCSWRCSGVTCPEEATRKASAGSPSIKATAPSRVETRRSTGAGLGGPLSEWTIGSMSGGSTPRT